MDYIVTILGVLAAIVSIAGFGILPEIRRRKAERLRKPRLHRFTSETPEAYWESFREVHELRFPDEEVADSYVDIRRWIDEWSVARKHPLHEMEEILIARCVQTRVRGYVYAQYYKDFQFAFISYIATDRRLRDATHEEDMGALLEGLLKVIRYYDPHWKAIIGELEETRILRVEGRERKQRHAEILFTVFMHASEALKRKKGIVIPIYSFLYPYFQPVLRPEEVPNDGSVVTSPELKQWILYVPNGPEVVIRRGGKHFVRRELAKEVLEFIFLRLYRDAFVAPKYQQYLHASLRFHAGNLNEYVGLATNPLEAAGREF